MVPSVPAAQTIPAASGLSYRAFSIDGSAKSPMVRTVAPTAPVVGASSTATMRVAMPSPPARWPNSALKPSSRSAARVVRCRMTPR